MFQWKPRKPINSRKNAYPVWQNRRRAGTFFVKVVDWLSPSHPSTSLKGPINFGEHRFAFGTQKRTAFNEKNRIYLWFWYVVKDMNYYLHEFVCLKKKCFFEFVCFPRFQKSINESRKTKIWQKIENLAKIIIKQQNDVGFSTNPIDSSVEYCMKFTSLKY